MLKGKLLRQYRKEETGGLVYVYGISGPDAEVADYENSLIENNIACYYDENTNQPLFFSTRMDSPTITLRKGQKSGRYAVDTTEVDQLVGLVDRFANTVVGDKLADKVATQLLDRMLGKSSRSTPAPARQEIPVPEEVADQDDLDEGADPGANFGKTAEGAEGEKVTASAEGLEE